MKTWVKVILIVILIVIMFALGFISGCKLSGKRIGKPIIIEGKTKYIKEISKEDCLGLWTCYNSPLMIDIMPKGFGKYTVKAYDLCKKRESIVEFPKERKRHIIIIGGVFQADIKNRSMGYGAAIGYYYLFGHAGIGGQIMGLNNGFGLQAGLAINF